MRRTLLCWALVLLAMPAHAEWHLQWKQTLPPRVDAADLRFYFDANVDHQSGDGINPQPVGGRFVDGRMILQGPGLLAAGGKARPGKDPKTTFDVTLTFVEPETIAAGKRVFSVSVAGQEVVQNPDVANGGRRSPPYDHAHDRGCRGRRRSSDPAYAERR